VRSPRGREKRWVVREGDGATVGEIVERAGEGAGAIEEGRVFVGRARAKTAAEVVRVGDEVRIGAAAGAGARTEAGAGARTGAGASAGAGAQAPGAPWAVIWERDGMIACDKPAGIPTVPDHGGASHSLVALAAQLVGLRVGDMRVTSRLDREVSGVVIFATTPVAEARLRAARELGRYARRYVAIAAARRNTLINVDRLDHVDQAHHADHVDLADRPRHWDAPIGAGKDARHRAAFGADAKEARTHWCAVACVPGYALLAVEPQTGRTHQIRVHASHGGAPLLGDRDYGGAARVTLPGGRTVALARIALHAARVTVPDASGAPLVAAAPVPAELTRAWTELGGAPEAWDMAMSCKLDP
jgi:23S rRNA pseudouridine1911/1915/1917 synthase